MSPYFQRHHVAPWNQDRDIDDDDDSDDDDTCDENHAFNDDDDDAGGEDLANADDLLDRYGS